MSSTARYRFEFRLFEWSETLAHDLCGETRCFFVGLRPDSSVRRIYFARSGAPFSVERKRILVDGHAGWFLYHPFAARGPGYAEWYDLDLEAVERWLKAPLDDIAFEDVRGEGSLHAWPTSWRVLM